MGVLEGYAAVLRTLKTRQEVEAEATATGDIFVQESLAASGTTPQQLMERYKLLKQIKAMGKKVDRIRSMPSWPGRRDVEDQIDELLEVVKLDDE